jgi:hypothetical protein
MKIAPHRNYDNQKSAESLDKVSERNFESFASNNDIVMEVDSEDSYDEAGMSDIVEEETP